MHFSPQGSRALPHVLPTPGMLSWIFGIMVITSEAWGRQAGHITGVDSVESSLTASGRMSLTVTSNPITHNKMIMLWPHGCGPSERSQETALLPSTPHPKMPHSQLHTVLGHWLHSISGLEPPPCRKVTPGNPTPPALGDPKIRPLDLLLSRPIYLHCSFQLGQCLLPTQTPLPCLNI